MSDYKDALIERLLDALQAMVEQHCAKVSDNPLEVDSFALSADAEAMAVLAEFGRMEIMAAFGRRVIARWTVEP